MESDLNCICFPKLTNYSGVLVKCKNCKSEMHEECYNEFNNEIFENFICFICQMTIYHPYLQCLDVIVNHFKLPKREKLEIYHKFQLSFDNLNSLRNNEKTLYFTFSRLKLKSEPKSLFFEFVNNSFIIFFNERRIFMENNDFIPIPFNFINSKDNTLHIISVETIQKPIIFLMFLGKNLEIEDLAKTICSRNFYSLAQYKNKIDEKIKNENSFLLPLIDPFTFKIIDIPCRGKLCQHVTCFDLINYLIVNKTSKEERFRWKCPLCGELAFWNELDVDLHVLNLLKEIKKISSNEERIVYSVIFEKDGSFEISERIPEFPWKDVEIRTPQKKTSIVLFSQSYQNFSFKKLKSIYYEIENFIYKYQDKNENIPFLIDISNKEIYNTTFFSDFTDKDFYYFLEAINIFEFYYSENRTKLFKQSQIDFSFEFVNDYDNSIRKVLKELVIERILIHLSLMWMNNINDCINLICRLMCKNGETFPNVLDALTLILVFADSVFDMEFLKIKFELEGKSFLGSIGFIMNHIIIKCNYDEMKIGKLVYILTESFAEFALNLKTPQISPLALNDLIEFYSQLCAHMEERSFFTFLQEIYLPPEEAITNQEEKNYWNLLMWFFSGIIKKRRGSCPPEDLEFFTKEWDKTGFVFNYLQENPI